MQQALGMNVETLSLTIFSFFLQLLCAEYIAVSDYKNCSKSKVSDRHRILTSN